MEQIQRYLDRYFQLDTREMEELYDLLDELYNDLIFKYLEALASPGENENTVKQLFEITKSLLSKESRSMEEDLMLIAVLDMLASDIHYRLYGGAVEQADEEDMEEE